MKGSNSENMKIIKLNNYDTPLNCISVFGQKQFVKGANRDTLTFKFQLEEYSIDTLLTLFKNEDLTSNITISNDTTSESYMYDDYSIFSQILISEESISEKNTEETIPIISITIGQLSHSEKLLKEQVQRLDNLNVVVADLLGGYSF